MNLKRLRVPAMATTSVLLLTGCSDYGWQMVTDETCGEISTVSPATDYPPLYYISSPNGAYFQTQTEWTVALPDGYVMAGPPVDNQFVQSNDAPEPVYGYGIPSLPLGWIGDVLGSSLDTEFQTFDPTDKYIYGFQNDPPYALQLNPETGDTFVYDRQVGFNDLPMDFADFAMQDNQLGYLPILNSIFHLPTTLITRCGGAINADSFFIGDSFRRVNYLGQSSSKEIFPGYVEDLVAFESEPTSVRFSSVDETDGRQPYVASVVPWFSGYFDIAFPGADPEFNFDSLTPFEQFWMAQLMYLQLTQGINSERALQLHAFFNPSMIGEADPNEQNPQEIYYPELQSPLNQETYSQLFWDSTGGQLFPGSAENLTRHQFNQELGELQYLFVYVFFVEELEPGNFDVLDISYSFDRYYPGSAGDIVTQQEFVLEQAVTPPAFLYSGPILSSAVPSRAKAGEIVTLSGSNLASISELSIDSANLEIVEKSSAQLKVRVPQGMKPGLKDVLVKSDTGQLTSQGLFTVLATPATTIKALGKTKVLVEVKNPVGLGRVQIRLNGKQVAAFNATNENDKALKNGRFSSQLNLLKGRKNAIQIYVNGEIVRSVSYRR